MLIYTAGRLICNNFLMVVSPSAGIYQAIRMLPEPKLIKMVTKIRGETFKSHKPT